ncbi:MAG: flippase-like domain-containing protein [Proteobacteria bacterium]|nr:flippase-like domain-containing protein [Pseudomonadota bacterium]
MGAPTTDNRAPAKQTSTNTVPKAEAQPRRKWQKTLLSFGFPVVVSVILVIWVIGDIEDPERVWSSIWGAALLPLLAVIPLDLASHFLRALRWRRFIGKHVSIYYSFSSLMIGYAVNGVIPRGGEIVRIVNMNRMTGIPIARLLATLIAERMIDLLTLLALIGLSIMVQGHYITEEFPVLAKTALIGLVVVGIGFIGLALLAFFPVALCGLISKAAGRISLKFSTRAEQFVMQGANGLAFLRSWRQIGAVFLETIGIWVLLWGAFFAGLVSFHLIGDIDLQGSAVTFSITSASVLVPSAGAIGAFHKLGLDSLVVLYQADAARSLAFITVLHLIAYYVVPVGGGILTWIGQILLHRRENQS